MIWSPAPEGLTLQEGEVHVWRAAIDGVQHLPQLEATLTDDERTRAYRFHFQRDRERYIAARGHLRALLSRYLDRPASDFRFTYSSYGKPALVGGDLQFNVSHSNQLALFAFSLRSEMGVDVEYIRADFGTLDIAENYFSAHEQAALGAMPAARQTDGFFTFWTRKEAYIKAIGEGLSMPLAEFDVSHDEPARLIANRRTPSEVERWSMFTLHPGIGYKGALVIEGQNHRLSCWQL